MADPGHPSETLETRPLMKKDLLSVALAYLLGVVALSFAGIVYTIGGYFAVWSPGHDVGYFINIHAGLLEKAGMAIGALAGALFFGLLLAFRRIRQLEALVAAGRTPPGRPPEPGLHPAGPGTNAG